MQYCRYIYSLYHVLVLSFSLHMCSFMYFQVAPKPNSFLPFGSGVHACPGNELAKLEILILTHHLVTKFRWDISYIAKMHIHFSKIGEFQGFYRDLRVWQGFLFGCLMVYGCRWEVVGSQGGIEYGPFPVPQRGLPARFWKLESKKSAP